MIVMLTALDRDMTDNSQYAVLTGDFIKSSQLSATELDAVKSTLRNAVDAVKGWKRNLVKGKLAFFRGDSWQLLLTDPALALRVAIYLRARLIGGGLADSRIAVGIGSVKNLSVSDISQSTGEAFSLSGEQLDSMKDPARLTCVVSPSVPETAALIPIVVSLCDALISEWTQRQAEIVSLAAAPAPVTQVEMGNALEKPVSQQFIAKSLKGSQWRAIEKALSEVEQSLAENGFKQP